MFKIFFLVLWFFLSCASFSHGFFFQGERQRVVLHEKYRRAEVFFNNKNYTEACVLYEELVEESPGSYDLNFKLGTCCLNMSSRRADAIRFLEEAVRLNRSSLDVYFSLGKAYHVNYQFEKAIVIFKRLLKDVSPRREVFRRKVIQMIEFCRNGLELVKNPVNISISNLGNSINTEFTEHSPSFAIDETVMVFTSRRNGTGDNIDRDGQFFEDIYISHFENDEWSIPQNISSLNTANHDASVSLSADGQELYLYRAKRNDRNELEGGDIYVSRLVGDEWSVPKEPDANINSDYKENHISISADGNSIYFTSNRPGGYGGMDIYVVKKFPNGEWGKARNLGSMINTEYDEEGPFIHPDGYTMYFSSKGHNSMGGLDIFKSTNIDGRWSVPINVGYPINSPKDDVYYTSTVDGKRAYLSSCREGSIGRTDIFLIEIPDSERNRIFVLKGKVISTSGNPVGCSKLTVKTAGEGTGVYNVNSETGKFLFIVKVGKIYDVKVQAEGYRTMRIKLSVDPEYANNENNNIITLLPLSLRKYDEPDYYAETNLIDFEKSKLNAEDAEGLDAEDAEERFLKLDSDVLKKYAQQKAQNLFLSGYDDINFNEGIYYTIQIMASDFPIDLDFFHDAGNVRMYDGNDGVLRYTYLRFKNFRDAEKELDRVVRMGYWDAFVRTVINGNLVDKSIEIYPDRRYTIQLIALKKSRPFSFFNDLGGVSMYVGDDKLYRYTYKTYDTRAEAEYNLADVLRSGFWDAFIRPTLMDDNIAER